MSIDILQEKVRKAKNPTVLEISFSVSEIPAAFSKDGNGYGAYCAALLEQLKGYIPAVRVSFSSFVLLVQR